MSTSSSLLYSTHLCSWEKIKEEFLHHFSNPRVDLLVWILVEKLAPEYYQRIEHIMNPISRFRDRHSWRKAFKQEWKRCEKKPTSLEINADRYRPDPHHWVCTCPQMAKSRFLICKHLVQSVHPVPPVFFLQVTRQRKAPFWKHQYLVPLDKERPIAPHAVIGDLPEDSDDEDPPVEPTPSQDDPFSLSTVEQLAAVRQDDEEFLQRHQTFQEKIEKYSDLLTEFAKGLRFQGQFNDHRMLEAFEREGTSLLRLMNNCLDRERRFNDPRAHAPRTFESGTANAMFWRPRPREGGEEF